MYTAGQPQPKLLLCCTVPTRWAAVMRRKALLKGSQLVIAHPELLLRL